MTRICFQNGPEAAAIFLEEEYGTDDEANGRLDSLVHQYGTVPEAVAWLEGSKPPKFGAFSEVFGRPLVPDSAPQAVQPEPGTTPTTTAPEPTNPSDVPDREPTNPDFVEVDATAGAEELAAEHNVALTDIEGTGQGGKVTKADVDKYVSEHVSS